MNVQEFLALPPREQDALVDAKVFGYEVRWAKPLTVGNALMPPDYDGPKDGLHAVRFFGAGQPVQEVPGHTKDIAAAWQVVERMRTAVTDKLRAHGGMVAVRLEMTHDGKTICGMLALTSDEYPTITGDTAPLAIGAAALLAMGAITAE